MSARAPSPAPAPAVRARDAAGSVPDLGGALRLLADPLRLRILALLGHAELSVGELARALGSSQSRVSNHLRLLRDSDLLCERHAGTSTYLRLFAPAHASGLVARLFDGLRGELDDLPESAADRLRLERVLAERRAREGDFFDRVAGEWDTVAGRFETGQARLRLASQLLDPALTVADLGSGTGTMGVPLLGLIRRLICVDRSEAMLAQAEKRLAPIAGRTALEFRTGAFDALPLADGEVDAALCGMVLHHLDDLDAALAEVRRVLRPGGALSLLELAPHKEAWMRESQGDRHLGLNPEDVLAALGRAGFHELALVPVDDHYRPRSAAGDGQSDPSLPLYLVRGSKPAR